MPGRGLRRKRLGKGIKMGITSVTLSCDHFHSRKSLDSGLTHRTLLLSRAEGMREWTLPRGVDIIATFPDGHAASREPAFHQGPVQSMQNWSQSRTMVSARPQLTETLVWRVTPEPCALRPWPPAPTEAAQGLCWARPGCGGRGGQRPHGSQLVLATFPTTCHKPSGLSVRLVSSPGPHLRACLATSDSLPGPLLVVSARVCKATHSLVAEPTCAAWHMLCCPFMPPKQQGSLLSACMLCVQMS